MKTIPLGREQKPVSVVGLGGEGVLRTHARENEAKRLITTAINHGISYYDCARVYADSELYYGAVWQEKPESREAVFQTSKSASRDKQGALDDLASSLQRLQTDYLDLWQIHDIRTEADFATISGPGGALEAFVSAREKGIVKNIGVTGHHDPHILTRAVKEWPVDTVLMPVNPTEKVIGGFLTDTLETALNKNVAVIGMKILGAGDYVQPHLGVTAEILIRYALACGITLPIVGCSTPEEVQTLAAAASQAPLQQPEMEEVTALFSAHAKQNAFYRGVIT